PAPEVATRAYRAPSTPIEEIIAGIYRDLLGVDRVGADDDFFELGGNSLIATQVIARLATALDARVPLRVLFEAPTVAALAVRAEEHAGSGGRPALQARPRPDSVPLSLAQQRMWFLNRLDPDSAAYNIPVAIRLTGSLDLTALEDAVADLFARHEILRTVYPEADGVGHQVVLPLSRVRPDVTPVPIDEVDILPTVVEFVKAGFDVTSEVPVRTRLYRVGDDEYVLVFVVH